MPNRTWPITASVCGLVLLRSIGPERGDGVLGSIFAGYVPLASHNYHPIIAELRRPEVPPIGAPYSYRKEKGTRELIFLMASGIARGRVRATTALTGR